MKYVDYDYIVVVWKLHRPAVTLAGPRLSLMWDPTVGLVVGTTDSDDSR
jgi:hypothetical protein